MSHALFRCGQAPFVWLSRQRTTKSYALLALILLMAGSPRVSAQSATPDLGDLSLDSLANTEITSVSRKEEKLSKTAAAAFVITQENIRRSGATSIPELLRMVPGMEVARIDANKWAVTARGFNERFADKILVMIDGRTVLEPLSSGVNWDVQNVMLEDVERIEVIRGPGASVWGANAVNGVVNVITKSAKETQGLLVVEQAGSQEHEAGAMRFGGRLGERGSYRMSAQYQNRGPFSNASGRQAADRGDVVSGAFRADWKRSSTTGFTMQGDIYSGNEQQSVTGLLTLNPVAGGAFSGTFLDKTRIGGGDVLANWHHSSSDRLDTNVQMYVEAHGRSQPSVLDESRQTIDLEFKQHLLLERNDLVWGGDYRYAADRTTGSLNLSFMPAARDTNLYGTYLQDEISLIPDTLRITLGAKLEHNSYSGFALQPNFRVLWTPSDRSTVWAGISRASENSSRMDADVRSNSSAFVDPNGVTTLVSDFGTHKLPPENVVAYELGHRAQVKKWLSFDTAAFYNSYSNRHTHEPGLPFLEASPEPLHVVIPTITTSNITGQTQGVELSATVHSKKLWRLTAGYTFFEIHLHPSALSQDVETVRSSEGSAPHHQVQTRLEFNLPHKLEFDTAVYYVGKLPGPDVADYTRVDARIGWRPTRPLELSLGMENMLDPRHFEFGTADLADATQIGRNAYGKVTWRF